MYPKLKCVQNKTLSKIKYVLKSNVSQNKVLYKNQKCPKSKLLKLGKSIIKSVPNHNYSISNVSKSSVQNPNTQKSSDQIKIF